MNAKTKIIAVIGISLMIFSCEQSRNGKMSVERSEVADSAKGNFKQSSASNFRGDVLEKKWIRTADMKFEVGNVSDATTTIENIARQFKGYVTLTDLNSTVNSKTTIPISVDSSLETVNYSVVNSMILRVPDEGLDSAIRTISTLSNYVDHKIVKADDVSLQILSNQLTQKRISNSEQRLTHAIRKKESKLKENAMAEDFLLEKQEHSDLAKINNLSLNDQVEYSTVTLSLYQRETIKRVLIANNKNIDAFKPSLGNRIGESLKSGWGFLESLIVFIVQMWPLILVSLVAFLIYRNLKKTDKKQMPQINSGIAGS